MTLKILITSAGGSGSNNLTDMLRNRFGTGVEIIGTHFDPFELIKAESDHRYIVPRAKELEGYLAAHERLFAKHKVDVLIPNSDYEAAAFASSPNPLTVHSILPNADMVEAVQDKFHFHRILDKAGCNAVKNVPISGPDAMEDAIAELNSDQEYYWIRARHGSGSIAATWLKTADQARKWMSLWYEMRGVPLTDYVIAPFLPGRDFCVSTMWQDGELCVGKAYERLSYMGSAVTLSEMGSAPKTARSIADAEPIETGMMAIRAVCDAFNVKPHGFFQADLKCDSAGKPFVTEINIGRFPQTITHFDLVGEHSFAEMYVKLAMDPNADLPRGVYDFSDPTIFCRAFDMKVRVAPESELDDLKKAIA